MKVRFLVLDGGSYSAVADEVGLIRTLLNELSFCEHSDDGHAATGVIWGTLRPEAELLACVAAVEMLTASEDTAACGPPWGVPGLSLQSRRHLQQCLQSVP